MPWLSGGEMPRMHESEKLSMDGGEKPGWMKVTTQYGRRLEAQDGWG
jgi:hypothetical protein